MAVVALLISGAAIGLLSMRRGSTLQSRKGKRVFAEGNSLLKVGVIMIALALALVIAAVVVSATVGSEPRRVVPAEVATKSPGETELLLRQGRKCDKNSSSQKESPHSSSGEKESLSYGSSSSSGGPVGQNKQEAEEPQAVLQQEAEPPKSQSPTPQPAGQQTFSEATSGPQLQPQPQKHQPHQQQQRLPG